MILVGVGYSLKTSEAEAIEEAYTQAQKSLNNNPADFILLWASSTTYDQQKLLDCLKDKSPKSTIVGCSSAGEITSVGGSVDDSVALMVIHSDQMKFVTGIGENVKANSRKAGQDLAKNILQNSGGEKPKAILMMPDGLLSNGEEVVDGVLDVMGKDFMLAGGSSGDDYTFKGTFQYYQGKVVSGCVVGVGLFGNFSFGIGVRHGLVPASAAHKVTKAEGNTIYEIDHKPAFAIYNQYFGKELEEIKAKGEPITTLTALYPFGIHAPNNEGYLIRGVLNAQENGSIVLTSGVPEGEDVFLMIASKEEIIDAAGQAAKQALARVGEGKQIKAIILFNCISRKQYLLAKRQEEVDQITQVFDPKVPMIGFYTYGEQAPLGEKVTTCSFHNTTDVIFALAE